MKIKDYLDEHIVIKIGRSLPGYVCCEIIVDNPKELISVVRENKCYISEIRWWDRAKIALGSCIGYGGPRDPHSPDNYFFAETDICKIFNTILQDEEYYRYLDEIYCTYANFDLFPAFDIRRMEDFGRV